MFTSPHRKLLIVLLVAALTGCGESEPANPLAADPFVGKFNGEALSAEFKKADAGYSGTITHKGKAYPAKGTVTEKKLTGTFNADGNDLAFTATLEGDAMTLESGGTTYKMTRAAEANPNPLATKDNAKPADGNPLATNTPTNPLNTKTATNTPTRTDTNPPTKTDTGPIAGPTPTFGPPGFSSGPGISTPTGIGTPTTNGQMQQRKYGQLTFNHPKTWNVQDTGESLALVPDDAKKDAQGQPLEVVVIAFDNADGVTDVNDPRVTEFIDTMMQQISPTSRRTGNPSSAKSQLGAGSLTRYEGRAPTGIDARIDVYTVLHADRAIFLVHIGEKTLVQARQSTVQAMFDSFGWTAN